MEAIETSGELSALFLESRLIKERSPLYNRRLKSVRRLALAKASFTPEGYKTLSIGYEESVPKDELDSILGVFRTLHQAKECVEEALRKHQLCPKICGLETVRHECFQYQLGRCLGACKGDELPAMYNARFNAAFKNAK